MSPEDEALAANERLYAALSTRDFATMDALWARHTPVTCIHPGWMPLDAREDVMRSWASIMSNPSQPRVVAGNARVRIAGDVAIVHCREFVAGAPLVATNIFVRESDEWRCIHHHSGPVARPE